jgi:hypothetical protein
MQSAKKETNKATILLTVPMDQFIWVCDQVDAGKAISRGEYIRNLILKDMGAVKA